MIEMMAVSGLLGEYRGSQAREVTMTLDEYERAKKLMDADAAAGYADLTEPQDVEEDEYEEDEYEDEYEDEEEDEEEE